ncbi:hypothetical protein FHS21_003060 [Phyllobacterium trifolii]|uniref:Uncharacterized protein n=1 Tax=Phyllobacterium trifolii TaxID=300193 RepID=A0A839U9L6_9HYPH|nr:hypothetical protein [Phyllobacterium trifolii]
MIVEGDDAIRHVDVVPPETFVWNNPLPIKSFERGALKEGTRKDVTRAVTEEDAVWKHPSFFGVFLDPGL